MCVDRTKMSGLSSSLFRSDRAMAVHDLLILLLTMSRASALMLGKIIKE